MAEKEQENEQTEQTKTTEKKNLEDTKRYKITKGYYRLTHYASYHSFRKSLVRTNRVLIFAVVLMFISLFTIPQIAYAAQSIVFAILIGYSFLYAWVMQKSKQIRKDSDYALRQVEFSNNVTITGWSFYDGVRLKDEKASSLEIGLTKDEPVITDVYRLIKKRSITLPCNKEEIDFLKVFISNLQNDQGTDWVIYGTFDPDTVKTMKAAGINLHPLSRKYFTKPGRFNYAVAAGSFKAALWQFPKFQCYQLTVPENVQ